MQGKATFRGHPLHPMLVLFPIAFWFGSLIADILYFATDTDFWTTLGTGLIAAAILCALLAAAAGFIDYFAAPRDATTTRAVTEHMVLSFLIVTAYSANLYLRVHTPEIPAGYLLSVLAILALMNSGGAWRRPRPQSPGGRGGTGGQGAVDGAAASHAGRLADAPLTIPRVVQR